MKQQTMQVLEAIRDAGGKPFIVGGFARDFVMGNISKDIDIEVFDLSKDKLCSIIKAFGEVKEVGESFGIFKLDMRKEGGDELDIALPRRESKQGKGHKGFVVESDPGMSIYEAASRRNFTINAIYLNPFTMEVIDPFNGRLDMIYKVLRATSERFSDDPLRVLIGMQQAARFGFVMSQATLQLCEDMIDEFPSLPIERINGEFMKMFSKGKFISYGMEVLRETNWVEWFPELARLIDSPQDTIWHPEGDVWTHTLQVMDAGVVIAEREELNEDDRLILLLACMCHDLGKPHCTQIAEEGLHCRITHHGHESYGARAAASLLFRMGFPQSIVEKVIRLTNHHMQHLNSHSEKSVKRLSYKLHPSNIKMLGWLVEADNGFMPNTMSEILSIASNLQLEESAVKSILLGRHLIEMGLEPSPLFSTILNEAFEAQMDGYFNDLEGAKEWFKRMQDKNFQ